MKRYVLKFGGSSVESISKMRKVAERIVERVSKDTELIIVVSAMGKITNNLFQKAGEITLTPNKRDLDLLLSTGEVVAITLLSIILNDMGYPAISLTANTANIYTTGEFQNSKIINIDVNRIIKHLKERKIVIVAGYQGVNEDGDITTLGREGSDTTAVNLAYYLNCDCEIYTDVDGIYEVDPRIISNSIKHENLSYDDLLLLSTHGAKVIATSAIEFASNNKIPLLITSTFNEDSKGTSVNNNIKLEKDFVGIGIHENVRILRFKNRITEAKLNKFINNGIRISFISDKIVSFYSDEVLSLEEAINNYLDEDEYIEELIDDSITKVTIVGNIIENSDFRKSLINALEMDSINNFYTLHNQRCFSIFISIDDTLFSIKKLYKLIKGKTINE